MTEFKSNDGFSISRRSFLKTFWHERAVAATAQMEAVAKELEKANAEKVLGPEPLPITLQINGQTDEGAGRTRMALLDVLRDICR